MLIYLLVVFLLGGDFVDYEIGEDTLAIISDGFSRTKIIEKDQEFVVEKSAFSIMEDSCEYYGSTYKGRVNAVKKLLKFNYKTPVLIEESRKIIFFPTKSYLLDDCSWINYNYIKKWNSYTNRR